MLQRVDLDDQIGEQDRSHLLEPTFYLQLAKRRWLYFVIPFILVLSAGLAAAWLWPASYLSEGKVLVMSQQIPTELVRPTVTNAAQERIQVIEQRTMTRDNLIAIADKFKLFPEKRPFMSPTELVDAVRKGVKIAPVELTLDFKQRSRFENPTIVFSVGYEYSSPDVAAQVANELMTRILNEDLRDRTNRASDTTRFLSREVQRLQGENAALDARIAQLRASQGKPVAGGPDQPTTLLGQLKAELAQKSAIYSQKHPMIQSLTKQIEAMEKAIAPSGKADEQAAASLEALTAQQEALQKNLETATAKLAAARLGENLEKDQQSERLQVIEQPTVPQVPSKPNRPKIAALALLAALAAGGGLAMFAELSDRSIRSSRDLYALLDNRLVLSIPYIVTAEEKQRRRRRVVLLLVIGVVVLTAILLAAFFFLPIDLILARAQVGLFR